MYCKIPFCVEPIHYILTYLSLTVLFLLAYRLLKKEFLIINTHRYIFPIQIIMILITPLTWGLYIIQALPGFCYFVNMIIHRVNLKSRLFYLSAIVILFLVYRSNYARYFETHFASIYSYPWITSIGLYILLLLFFSFLVFYSKNLKKAEFN